MFENLQPANALSLIFVTELGRVMELNFLHPSNAPQLMLVILFEKITEVNPAHPLKTYCSMLKLPSPFGKITEVKFKQPANAS
jgi:hypothetical protein